MGADLSLEGMVALVTGGSRGIGNAIATRLASFGCSVAIVGRGAGDVEDAVARIRDAGGTAVGATGDVRVERDVIAIVGRVVEECGGIDVLVNNAGGSYGDDFSRGPLAEISAQDLMNTFRANVLSSFLCARAALPFLRKSGRGSIVNIASVVVRTPMVQFGAYSAAKSAVVSLTETMAIEWAPEVRVNSLLVGHIDTERARRRRTKEDEVWLERHIALRRMGTPDDVAGAAVFLASTQSAWMTGAAIPVDGGMRAV